MKITPKNIAKAFALILALILQDIRINLFNYIPLFFLKWPVYINVILVILFVVSTIRWKGNKIDKFLKRIAIINVILNISVWVMALISFINGTVNCNPIVFYVLFGISTFLTITKIPKMLKEDKDEKTEAKQ